MERAWQRDLGGIRVRVVKADPLNLSADALVIPSCSLLKMDTAIAATVRDVGGEEIEREAGGLAPVAVGAAVVTGAGRLPYRSVVHAAAFDGEGRTSEDRLRICAFNALKRCCDNGLARVVIMPPGGPLPGISSASCCRAVLEGIRDFCLSHRCALRQVDLASDDDDVYRELAAGLERASREGEDA